ncbi:hypothetical protein DFJ73DRAFT_587144 [Zopfochytrium polystomum]|nr:hypothetical protein DFJ73DRAFT_587144 [Zopfochytrium polystomum]
MHNPTTLVAEMSVAGAVAIEAVETDDGIVVFIAQSDDVVVAVVRGGLFHRLRTFANRYSTTMTTSPKAEQAIVRPRRIRFSKSKKILMEEINSDADDGHVELWASKVESPFEAFTQTKTVYGVDMWTAGERKGKDVIIFVSRGGIYMLQAEDETRDAQLLFRMPSVLQTRSYYGGQHKDESIFLHEGKRILWAADDVLACILEIPDEI